MEKKKKESKGTKEEVYYRYFTELEDNENPFIPGQEDSELDESDTNSNSESEIKQDFEDINEKNESSPHQPDLKKDIEEVVNIAGESLKKGIKTLGKGIRKGFFKIAEKIEQAGEEIVERQKEKEALMKKRIEEEFQNMPDATEDEYEFDEDSEFVKQMSSFSTKDMEEEDEEEYEKTSQSERLYRITRRENLESENKDVDKEKRETSINIHPTIPAKKTALNYGDNYSSQAEKSALSYIQQIADGKIPENEMLKSYDFLVREQNGDLKNSVKSNYLYWRSQLFLFYSELVSVREKDMIHLNKIQQLIERILAQLNKNSHSLAQKKEISEILDVLDKINKL